MTTPFAPPARRAETLFHDTWLPEETRRIRAEVRAFAEAVLRSCLQANRSTSQHSIKGQILRPMMS